MVGYEVLIYPALKGYEFPISRTRTLANQIAKFLAHYLSDRPLSKAHVPVLVLVATEYESESRQPQLVSTEYRKHTL